MQYLQIYVAIGMVISLFILIFKPREKHNNLFSNTIDICIFTLVWPELVFWFAWDVIELICFYIKKVFKK